MYHRVQRTRDDAHQANCGRTGGWCAHNTRKSFVREWPLDTTKIHNGRYQNAEASIHMPLLIEAEIK